MPYCVSYNLEYTFLNLESRGEKQVSRILRLMKQDVKGKLKIVKLTHYFNEGSVKQEKKTIC